MEAAKAGSPEGESKLAELLMQGAGVEANNAEAAEWCRKAADHGHAFAQGMLGFLYTTGTGVEQNDDEAFKWSQMSALQGDAAGQWVLAECYLWARGTAKDPVKAREWLVKSGKSGYFRSQRRLAEIYYYGLDVERNYAEAGRWASLAADQGDAEAQTIVGEMFVFGYGVEADPVAAAKWLVAAADQGHAKAQGLLGVMHAEGVGVKRDWIHSLKWLKKAAESGDERALEFLKESGVEFKPGQENKSRHSLSADQPVAKNPSFDIALVPGTWVTTTEDPVMDIVTVFESGGTFHAEGKCEGLDTWHYSGRWAVDQDKLLWDVQESDMPFPFDDDMDDVVVSISDQEWITKNTEGKLTTYRRQATENALGRTEPVSKVVQLGKRSADKSGTST
jgi:TPR repeat protein